MLNFLFIIIMIVLFIVIGGLFTVFGVVRSIFGQQPRNRENTNTSNQQPKDTGTHKKIFSSNEGEYVDFEEVKEDK